MSLALLLSLVLAIGLAAARPSAALGGLGPALWFFRHWERVRVWATLIWAGLAVWALTEASSAIVWHLWVGAGFTGFAWLFDLRRVFLEIALVDRRAARGDDLEPGDAVLGVTVEHEAVAYPIAPVLISRHLIHDRIADVPVLMSYCALFQSALGAFLMTPQNLPGPEKAASRAALT